MPSSTPASYGVGQAAGATTIGADGVVVAVTATITAGPDSFRIDGVSVAGAFEARDRIRAAILNSGLPWPGRAITVDVQPAGLPWHDPGLDLAVALAIISASAGDGLLSRSCACIAELGLDGSLRPVPGILPAVIAAAARHAHVIVAAESEAQAGAVPGVTVVPARSLREAMEWLQSGPLTAGPRRYAGRKASPAPAPEPGLAGLDVPPVVRLALEASAAGGHHLTLTGPHGLGIPAMAAGVARLMPDLGDAEALEVSAIHSVADLLSPDNPLVTRPPLRTPHHAISTAGMAGGGRGLIWPGEAALAHRGVLYLQDAPEFAADTLAVLRQPLQDGQVTVARGGRTVTFRARPVLVASSSPCPCGGHRGCSCTPLAIGRYHRRLIDVLGRYIPLRLDVNTAFAAGPRGGGDQSADAASAARVAAARDRARTRLAGTGCQLNAEISPAALQRSGRPAPDAAAIVRRATDLGQLSISGATQVLRVAWTLADLAGRDRPGASDVGQALALWMGTAR